MTYADFKSFYPCSIERLYCYGKARSYFFPHYEQFIIFAQLLDRHAFEDARLFLDRTDDNFLTFYYIVMEKAAEVDSSYSDLFEYVKNIIVDTFNEYYRKGVRE